MTEQWTWQPIKDGEVIESIHLDYLGHPVHEQISVHDGNILVANGPSQYDHTSIATVTLPADKRLCERVPAPQAGVPVVPEEAREAFEALLELGDPMYQYAETWNECAAVVTAYFDSQRQGQEDSEND